MSRFVTRWDRDIQARALAIYREHGAAVSAQRTGVPKGTVHRWAKAAGLASPVAAPLAANAAKRLSVEERRHRLAERLLDDAEWLRCHLAVQGSDEPINGAELKNRTIAMAILVDKAQLLAGQPTSRTERMTPEQAEALKQQLTRTGRFEVVS